MTFDPGDPVLDPWGDRATPAQRWRTDWANRAAGVTDRAALESGFVLTHTQCLALGYSPAQRRTLVRRGVWSAPRRGVVAVVHPNGDVKVAATLASTAAALIRPGSVISTESAAIVYGLPVLDLPAAPILTVEAGRSGARPNAFLHRAPLQPDDVRRWYGCPVTSVARTVVDIARGDREAGLTVADAALYEGLTSVAELSAAVGRSAGWAGNATARWVVQHADGRSESPLESLTRSCLLVAGLPAPDLQVWIEPARARVDLLYRAERLVIEADGLLKYQSPADLRDEKRRQERLERAGYRVMRVLWDDVRHNPSGTAARIRAALSAIRPSRPDFEA